MLGALTQLRPVSVKRWQDAVGEQSPVKCLQQQQQQQGYNPGLPAHWGEHVSWLRIFNPTSYFVFHLFSLHCWLHSNWLYVITVQGSLSISVWGGGLFCFCFFNRILSNISAFYESAQSDFAPQHPELAVGQSLQHRHIHPVRARHGCRTLRLNCPWRQIKNTLSGRVMNDFPCSQQPAGYSPAVSAVEDCWSITSVLRQLCL